MITSTSNALVKRVRALRRRRARDRLGVFFAEGIAVTIEAVEANAPLECLVVAPDLLTSEAGLAAVTKTRESGTKVTEVSGEVFAAMSCRDDPTGLAAVVRAGYRDLAGLDVGERSIVVALQEPANPGNLGTILRTADATGCDCVVLCGPSTDPFAPESVRASMGAVFRVPVARARDTMEAASWSEAAGLEVVATSAHAGTVIWDAELPTPATYLFGSEQRGLDEATRARSNLEVGLPIAGSASSLNLAVAVGVVLYEAVRRRTV